MATLVFRRGRARLQRSVRVGGKVTSRYLAGGQLAELMAEAERLERGHREALRQIERGEHRERVEADRRLDEAVAVVVAQARALARQVLVQAGYHQHDRGAWRRRRGGRAVAEREIQVTRPQDVTRMDAWAVGNVCKMMAGTNQKVYDQLMEELGAVAVKLAGANPTPIEEQLAWSVAISWAAVRHAEAQLAGNLRDASVPQVSYLQSNLDRAHRRHLAAVRTLATVRRLAGPSIQLNLAATQQVNNAGPSHGAIGVAGDCSAVNGRGS